METVPSVVVRNHQQDGSSVNEAKIPNPVHVVLYDDLVEGFIAFSHLPCQEYCTFLPVDKKEAIFSPFAYSPPIENSDVVPVYFDVHGIYCSVALKDHCSLCGVLMPSVSR